MLLFIIFYSKFMWRHHTCVLCIFISQVIDCAKLKRAVDLISAIEFERRGEYLATGDRGGRVVLFERTDGKV